MSVCKHAKFVEDDLYLCTKYKSYCYFSEPDLEECIDVYGSEYIITNDIQEDEENVEDSI